MRAGRIIMALSFAVLFYTPVTPSRADEPGPANGVAPGPATKAGLVVSGSGREATFDAATLSALPSIHVSMSAGTEPGAHERSFEGPLLWTVLAQAGAIDPAKHQDDVRQVVVITGRDGYTAILGLGELSPEFEGKQVILSGGMDGQPLGPDHLRVIVPGDKRGGRGVHDVVRVSVAPVAPAPQRAAR